MTPFVYTASVRKKAGLSPARPDKSGYASLFCKIPIDKNPAFYYNKARLNDRFKQIVYTGGGEKMTSVVLRPNESQDQLLKRFRKKVVKSGVLSTVRRKRWFVSQSETDRVERKKTLRRLRRHSTGRPE